MAYALDRLDAAALAAKLEDTTRNIELLKKENATLESYLHRHVTVRWAQRSRRISSGFYTHMLRICGSPYHCPCSPRKRRSGAMRTAAAAAKARPRNSV